MLYSLKSASFGAAIWVRAIRWLFKRSLRMPAQAHSRCDRILFNRKTGILSFDADGSGKEHEAVAFAKLTTKTLGAHDFLII